MKYSVFTCIGTAALGLAFSALPPVFAADAPSAAQHAHDGAPAVGNRQVENAQAQLRDLLAQLDELDELHTESDRRPLMNRHWQAMQDFLRQLARLQTAAPESALGIYGSAAACRLALTMDTGRYISQMRDTLWDLRDRLADVRQEQDPGRRAQALHDASRRAYQKLQAIRGYGWMYGSVAPIRETNPPVADSASEPAYLVRRYCGQCHAPPPPDLHSANEWSAVASKMERHMGVAAADNPQEIERPSPHEMTLITTYLEDHGCEPVR